MLRSVRYASLTPLVSGNSASSGPTSARCAEPGLLGSYFGIQAHQTPLGGEVLYYVEQDDNESVENLFAEGYSCEDQGLPFADYQSLICGTRVITLNDRAGCDLSTVHQVGGQTSRELDWHNCAGWPSIIEFGGNSHFPTVLRIWTR